MDTARIDQAVNELADNKQTWARLPIAEKRELLAEVRSRTDRVAQRWVGAAVQAKGIPADSPLVGEEWASGPWALVPAAPALGDQPGKVRILGPGGDLLALATPASIPGFLHPSVVLM